MELFLREQQAEGRPPTLFAAAMAALHAYDWPGNVRELKNVIRTAAALASGGEIGPDLLPERIGLGSPVFETETGLELAKREAARKALIDAAGNQSAAARSLGVSRTTLYKYLSVTVSH